LVFWPCRPQSAQAVLGAVALGLVCYGMFKFVEARFRQMVIT
jgi:hypothetical protein